MNNKNWKYHLTKVYGEKNTRKIIEGLKKIPRNDVGKNHLTNNDIFVISYADSIRTEIPSLANIGNFLKDVYPNINYIHYLPFFEWTSDDGFSVKNYKKIDPRYGQWKDLNGLDGKYKFMFDFVANHTSKESEWFKLFLEGDDHYEDFYIQEKEWFDYSRIIRPRTSPLFHDYNGKKVWTTFSEDQVDLNFKSYKVFLASLEILAFYVSKGMRTIRLDAVGFLWKESGHTGMHHDNTHHIIKAIKGILNMLFGEINIISEVNVPHSENMSYLGDNGNESDEVYNFALPPLMAFTLLKQDATKFKEWMKFFDNLKTNETMFNFLSSHDGIGLRPVENILTDDEKNILVTNAKRNGGLFNLKSMPDGKTSIYEINSTYYDLIYTHKSKELELKKYILPHALLLLFRGTPAFYINSLLLRRNYFDGVAATNMNRTINREKTDYAKAVELTKDEEISVFVKEVNKFMDIRKNNIEFDPYSSQEIIGNLPKEIIGFKRGSNIEVYANISEKEISFGNINIKPYEILIFKGETKIK